MKYLKLFKIFESNIPSEGVDKENRFKRYNLISDVTTAVSDILMELEDDGYNVLVRGKTKNISVDSLNIKIESKNKNISIEILDYIERVNDYMESKKVFSNPDIFIFYRDNRNYIGHNRHVIDMSSLLEYFNYDISISSIDLTFTIFKIRDIEGY